VWEMNQPVILDSAARPGKLTLEDLAAIGTLPEELASWLGSCVRGRVNAVVSGGAGSGKTTLLNCLCSLIPPEEKIVAIEDCRELNFTQPHVVRLEVRPHNLAGEGGVTAKDLIASALRLRPERIIVGEVRWEEAWDFLLAVNTGHDGSMTTVHGNSPQEALLRLFYCARAAVAGIPDEAIWQHVRHAVELVIQVERMPDGSRRVVSVCQGVGEEAEPLWAWDGACLRPTGVRPRFEEKLRRSGVSLPEVGA